MKNKKDPDALRKLDADQLSSVYGGGMTPSQQQQRRPLPEGNESDVVKTFYCPICGKEIRLKRPMMLFKARQEHIRTVHKM